MSHCVILGAGKIARGFIGHLLYLSGHTICYAEKSKELVDLLNSRGGYTVQVLGAPEQSLRITGYTAVWAENTQAVVEQLAKVDLVFTAMGGKNLTTVAPSLVAAMQLRRQSGNLAPLNLITCENWKQPADGILNACSQLAGEEWEEIQPLLGITEAVIMRSAIEADSAALAEDPLVVNVQNFWDLPVDAARVKGSIPQVHSMRLIDNFGGFLDKKFYTYNAANGTTSYLGSLLGYTYISDAARDPFILQVLEGVYAETAAALSAKLNLPIEDLQAFGKTSLAKLQDSCIVDYVERNARDPIRKLGPDDRLVGPARLCLTYGVTPEHLAMAIAAAIHYQSPEDPAAQQLAQQLAQEGTGSILTHICGLPPGSPLHQLVLRQEAKLQSLMQQLV